MRITAYAYRVDSDILTNVKGYILNACRFDHAIWPSSTYKCAIWKDGRSVLVSSGANWVFSDNKVYVDSNPDSNIPIWAAGALRSIAEFYGLNEDTEVSSAIDGMIEAIRARMQDDSERAVASSRRGMPARKVAFHNQDLIELAYYNVAAPNEEVKMEWRDHEGNVYDVNEEDSIWTIMEL